jgi:hypothetical protein
MIETFALENLDSLHFMERRLRLREDLQPVLWRTVRQRMIIQNAVRHILRIASTIFSSLPEFCLSDFDRSSR